MVVLDNDNNLSEFNNRRVYESIKRCYDEKDYEYNESICMVYEDGSVGNNIMSFESDLHLITLVVTRKAKDLNKEIIKARHIRNIISKVLNDFELFRTLEKYNK